MINLIYITLIMMIIGLAFPEETITFLRKVKRSLRESYAKRNGKEAAEKYIPYQHWE